LHSIRWLQLKSDFLTMKKLLVSLFVFTLPFLATTQNNQDSIDISYIGEVNDTVRNESFFETDKPLPITLEYDITSFIKNKRNGEYLDAVLTVNYEGMDPITKNIRIKARGNFRRGECFFPPLFLNFKTDPIENEELKGLKKIKVVTPCSTTKYGETYVFREYLVYKIYSVLSEYSFRVRLLDIDYIDTGKKERNYKKFGFIIEPLGLVSKRNNAMEIDSKIVTGKDVEVEDADRVAFFRYLISDTDWRFKSGHNIKYLKSLNKISDKVIPVPYDFDFSGFVNTNYSFPQEWASNTNSVLEREYLGYCRDNKENYLKTIKLFNDKKEEIINTIKDFRYLSDKEKKSVLDFVEEFYIEISNPDRFINNLEYFCRGEEF